MFVLWSRAAWQLRYPEIPTRRSWPVGFEFGRSRTEQFLQPSFFNRFFRTLRAAVQPMLNGVGDYCVRHARAHHLDSEMRR